MIVDRKATDSDLVDVLSRLCDAHKAELDFLGLDRGEALAMLRRSMRDGETDAGVIDGRAECLFGVVKNTVWFIATQRCFDAGTYVVRFGRRYLKRAADRFGTLNAATSSSGKDVAKWLTVLGFRPVAEVAGMCSFVYG